MSGLDDSGAPRFSLPTFLARLVAGGVPALLVLELLMRFYAFAPRELQPDLGYVVAARATTHWNREGNGTGHWGAHGVRATPTTHASGKTVLVLGDSLTEAVHVDDDETFVARAQAALDRRGLDLALQNAGIESRNAPHYIAQAPVYRRLFSPAWTVIVVTEGDLATGGWQKKNTRFAREPKGDPNGRVIVIAEPLEGKSGRVRRTIHQLWSRSALVQNVVVQGAGFARAIKRWHAFHADASKNAVDAGDDGDWPIADEVELLVDAFEKRATIVVLPVFDPADPKSETTIEHAVLAACAADGFSCVSARDAYRDLAAHGDVPQGFPNTHWNKGHLNPRGHAAVARVIEKELARLVGDGLL